MTVKFLNFIWRVTVVHVVTYFLAGLFFSQLFNYTALFNTEILSVYMRPTSSPWIAAGPALNVFRGIMFGIILWFFKDSFFETKNGWLKLWVIFIGFAILGTAAAAQGSFEGMIYSRLPLRLHLSGMPEVFIQTGMFSVLLSYWNRKPGKIWNIIMGPSVFLILLMSLAGVFLR